MTGELTLTGRVLPIGGVKEKLLGAVRAGIHEIIIPAANDSHLEDLPDEVRKALKIHLVEDLHEVMDIALRGRKLKRRKTNVKRSDRAEESAALS